MFSLSTFITRPVCYTYALFLGFVFSHTLTIEAQLTVNESQTPAQLASLITGTGVAISNVAVTCTTTNNGRGYGSYNATSSNLNITEGLLLTTGRANNAIGPNNSGDAGSWSGNNANATLPSSATKTLLENYSGKTVYEFCKFEFDIVPQGDSIIFDYVFASEEYNEWVGSNYNDMFGFFISGPGITGDANAGGRRNLAKIPNTNTPVSINTVNNGTNNSGPCTNCSYFQNNSSGTSVQYDGFTRNLKAKSAVQPCSTYHLELIVADCGDRQYDSGVFIEKIRSNAVTVTGASLAGIGYDAIEGCNAGVFTFTRGTVTNKSLTVNYWLSGTALNGVDYPLVGSILPIVPRTITIPANQASATLTINAYADGIPEPTENINVSLFNTSCPSGPGAQVSVNLRDSIFPTLTPAGGTICQGATGIQLTAGNAASYTWGPAADVSSTTGATVTANPSVSKHITVTAKLGSCTEAKSAYITVNPAPADLVPNAYPAEACLGGTTQIRVPGSANGVSYQLRTSPANTNVGAAVNGNGGIVGMMTGNIFAAQTFNVYATNTATGCSRQLSNTVTVTVPGTPSQVANNNDERGCFTSGSNWVHFTQPGTNRILASINPNGQDLGWVDVREFVNGSPINVPACGTDPNTQPQFITAAMGRRWVVDPQAQPSANINIRFYINNTDFTALQTAADANVNPNDNLSGIASLGLSKYSGANEDGDFANNCGNGTTLLFNQAQNGTVSSFINGFSSAGRYVEYVIPSCSEMWLHGFSPSAPSPLPIELKSFDAVCGNNGVEVLWTTASESNNEYFSIERSADMSAWEEIARVAGAGNSNEDLSYSYTDVRPLEGVAYYRLKQTDYNGDNEIFAPKSVSCSAGAESTWSVYPNPISDVFTVKIASLNEMAGARIQMLDMSGKTVKESNVNISEGENYIQMNRDGLAAGSYIIRLMHNSNQALSPLRVIIR